jgi:hypothetical protein
MTTAMIVAIRRAAMDVIKALLNHSFDRPLTFAREVALPQRVGTTRESFVPGIQVGMRIRLQFCFFQDIAYRLTRGFMTEPVQCLAQWSEFRPSLKNRSGSYCAR